MTGRKTRSKSSGTLIPGIPNLPKRGRRVASSATLVQNAIVPPTPRRSTRIRKTPRFKTMTPIRMVALGRGGPKRTRKKCTTQRACIHRTSCGGGKARYKVGYTESGKMKRAHNYSQKKTPTLLPAIRESYKKTRFQSRGLP